MKKAAVLVVALLLVPTAAVADGGGSRDGDEQPFCEGAPPEDCPDTDYMDFRRASFGHGPAGGVVRHGLRTIKRWKTKDMGGRHGVTIYVEVNTDDDRRVEREVRIRRKRGAIWAGMFRGKYFRKRVEGRVRAWRPDRRRVKIGFRVRMLGDGVDRYRWRVFWANRAVACPGSCHTDFVPDRGWFEHRL